MPHQDSSSYLRLLKNLSDQDRQKLRRKGKRGADQDTQAKSSQVVQETHQGWQLGDAQPTSGIQQLRLAQFKKILHQAYMNTPKKDRGLLPGDILTTLLKPQINSRFTWQQLVSRQVGTLAAGREEAAYRFNRRQPWRMELPGAVSRLVPRVLVFVDNSGSVTDDELEKILSQISYLTNSDHLPVEIYPFDARVHSEHYQHIENGKRVIFHRVGGGGTSFQCIFDFLHDRHINPTNSLVVIMTDGWGEQKINPYNFHQVDWLVTGATTDLSLQRPVGRVRSLKKEIK